MEEIVMSIVGRSFPEMMIKILNGAELGGATGAMAPLVFWSRSIKKSRKVSKSKSRSLEWHQLFLPSFGANGNNATNSSQFKQVNILNTISFSDI